MMQNRSSHVLCVCFHVQTSSSGNQNGLLSQQLGSVPCVNCVKN